MHNETNKLPGHHLTNCPTNDLTGLDLISPLLPSPKYDTEYLTELPSLCLPSTLVRNVVGIHGLVGEDWLASLPVLCFDVAERWNIALALPQSAFPLSFNYVVRGVRRNDDLPVVLKLGVPCAALEHEVEALRAFSGCGAARLLQADTGRGALLLECVSPGTSLHAVSEQDDAVGTGIAARVMRSLRTPATVAHRESLPHVAHWARGMQEHRARFGGTTGPLPVRLFEHVEQLFAELLPGNSNADYQSPLFVLHGDLHHGNVLHAGEDRWCAIDPKGVVGPMAFEPSAFLLHLSPDLPLDRLMTQMAQRLAIFADVLELDRECLRQWALARAVLSAAWGLSVSYDGWRNAVTVAEYLASL